MQSVRFLVRVSAAFALCTSALLAQVAENSPVLATSEVGSSFIRPIQPGTMAPRLAEPIQQTEAQEPAFDEPDFPLATPVEAVDVSQPEPLTLKGKTDYWLKASFSPQVIARLALTSGFSQVGNSDYGTGMEGYGERVAARYASHLTRRTVQFGIGALRGEDPRFRRSGKDGVWNRTKFVLSRTVVADMDNGGTSIAAGKLVGNFAGGALSAYWHPSNPEPWKRGLTNLGANLAGDLGMRMLREFWPDIKKLFR